MSKPLIKRLQVKNFKCLRDVLIDLEPLTVFIGKNDTGKSSALEAIDALAWCANHPGQVPNHLVGQGYVSHDAASKTAKVAAVYSDNRTASVQFGSSDSLESGHWDRLKRTQPPYRLVPTKLRQHAQVGTLGDRPLPPDGSGLAAAIDRLPLSRFIALQDALLKRIPTIRELRPTPGELGHKQLWFDVKGFGLLPATQMSDGVMLVLAFLAIVHDENPPPLIMVEEPETGVHPKQLEHLTTLFDSLTQHDPPIQVILTTHSPYLLDFVSRDSVRVFTRREDGGVDVHPLHSLEPIKDMMSKGFTLGEAWYNSDEDELTQGKKSAGASSE